MAYFFHAKPPKLERYDLVGRKWQETINFPEVRGEISAATVDKDGLVIAYGKEICRYSHDGTGEIELTRAQDHVDSLHTDGNLLIVNHSSDEGPDFSSYNKSNNALLAASTPSYYGFEPGAVSLPRRNLIVGLTGSNRKSALTHYSYTEDGKVEKIVRRNEMMPKETKAATRAWPFPGEGRILDDEGQISSTYSSGFLGKLNSRVDDVQFVGQHMPIILQGDTIAAYYPNLEPAGIHKLPVTPSKIFLNNKDVLAFTPDASAPGGARVDVVPFTTLKPSPGSEPGNPHSLQRVPDEVFVSKAGTVCLYSMVTQCIHRWDPRTRSYLPAIPLSDLAEHITYSRSLDTVYVAYAGGAINKISLAGPKIQEESYAKLDARPYSIAAAGKYLVVLPDELYSMDRRYIALGQSGQTDLMKFHVSTEKYVWSEAAGKMFGLASPHTPFDLVSIPVDPSGKFGEPSHKSQPGNRGLSKAMSVSPDGTRIAFANGLMQQTADLSPLPAKLPYQVTDVAWLGNDLYTLRNVGSTIQIQQWPGRGAEPGGVLEIPGNGIELLEWGDSQLVVVSLEDKRTPKFEVLNAKLQIASPAKLIPPSKLVMETMGDGELTLAWNDVSGEKEYVIQRREAESKWVELTKTKAGITTCKDAVGLEPQKVYSYRVQARNGDVVSAFSTPLEVEYRACMPPGSVEAKSRKAGKIHISWGFVENSTAFHIYQKELGDAEFQVAAVNKGNDHSHIAEDLVLGSTYVFHIVAETAEGKSLPSQEVSATAVEVPAKH